MKETAVCLEVDYTTGLHEPPVTLEEKRACQAAVLALELRIRKSQPNLADLSRTEESVDKLNTGAKESHVLEPFLRRRLGTSPKPRPLDVHTYVVALRNTFGKINRVLPFPAAKFQDNRLVFLEHNRIPMPLDRMVIQLESLRRIPAFVKHL